MGIITNPPEWLKKSDNILCWQRIWKTEPRPLHCHWEYKMIPLIWKIYQFLKKVAGASVRTNCIDLFVFAPLTVNYGNNRRQPKEKLSKIRGRWIDLEPHDWKINLSGRIYSPLRQKMVVQPSHRRVSSPFLSQIKQKSLKLQ